MIKILLSVFVLASVFANCLAITCHHRSLWSSHGNEPSEITCTANGSVCYSYISYSTYYASCGVGVCAEPSCITCNTDYCNTFAPSTISCYSRSFSSSGTNGTMTMCPKGISTCYTHFYDGEAGCGSCVIGFPTEHNGCSTCSTNYCNSLTPSSISCFTRTSSTPANSSGEIKDCPTAISSCYMHSKFDEEAGCGICTTTYKYNYGCTTCSSNYCNARASLAFRCLARSSMSTSGSISVCPSGASSCYMNSVDGEAGCGNCTASSISRYGCTSCNSSYCNAEAPLPFGCYTRSSGSLSTTHGTKETCTIGLFSCYAHNDGAAGCGKCTASSISSYGCTPCSSSYCNTRATLSISCYTRSSGSISTTNGTMSACNAGVSSCYTHNDGEAGCGTCTSYTTSRYSCTSCNTNYCNTAVASTFGCYTRSVITASISNGTTSTCRSGVSTCYAHSDGEAGCGTCSIFDISIYGCTSCSSSFCNYRFNTLKCYSASASYQFRDRYKLACYSATSCYHYSVDNYYYAGCGSCSSTTPSGCLTCYTNYCNSNSATIAAVSVKIAAASATMLLALMKLL